MQILMMAVLLNCVCHFKWRRFTVQIIIIVIGQFYITTRNAIENDKYESINGSVRFQKNESIIFFCKFTLPLKLVFLAFI